jgi:hypothetical protein
MAGDNPAGRPGGRCARPGRTSDRRGYLAVQADSDSDAQGLPTVEVKAAVQARIAAVQDALAVLRKADVDRKARTCRRGSGRPVRGR